MWGNDLLQFHDLIARQIYCEANPEDLISIGISTNGYEREDVLLEKSYGTG